MVPRSGDQRLEINAWASGTILLTDRVRGLGTSGVSGNPWKLAKLCWGLLSLPIRSQASTAYLCLPELWATAFWKAADPCEGLYLLYLHTAPRWTLGGYKSWEYAALTSSSLLVVLRVKVDCRAIPLAPVWADGYCTQLNWTVVSSALLLLAWSAWRLRSSLTSSMANSASPSTKSFLFAAVGKISSHCTNSSCKCGGKYWICLFCLAAWSLLSLERTWRQYGAGL